MEQLVARRAHNPKVTGSSPVPATLKEDASASFFVLNYLRIWRAHIRYASAHRRLRTPVCFLFQLQKNPIM